MSIENLIDNLNENQRIAATFSGMHALVLAGAGTGKTRTIIARAGYLIHSGVPADRIQVLTFTRRSAKEIVERVQVGLGDRAEGLNASTFHTWCMTLIRRMPKLFGCAGHTVIDREDQIHLFQILRGSEKSNPIPPAKILCDIYSFARNTRLSLTKTLELHYDEQLPVKHKIADVIRAYETKKRARNYLDYDDILDVVATVLKQDSAIRDYISQQYDHLLVDEMQDTNPLQWDLLEPLSGRVKLFCVGDDAQSIYGFRGADFRNVHSFTQRIPNSVVLRLEQNYRSTQEILDLSNWLLEKSSIDYNKRLVAVRGNGHKPKLVDFQTEWDEGRWIADDIVRRRSEGSDWAQHMILTRSAFSARAVETTLLARNIPYRFIGGTALFNTAHIRDLLSLLRIVANPLDELAWIRFLTLWPKVGDVTANRVIEQLPSTGEILAFVDVLNENDNLPAECKLAFISVAEQADNPGEAYIAAKQALGPILEHAYTKDWDKRRGDLDLVEKLVKQHTSILAFIEEYLLDPVYSSAIGRLENEDVVDIVTIHSAKGTEKPVCYIINVSPGSFPPSRTIENSDEVEEERRVLYVALTRAQDELILTRRRAYGNGYALRASEHSPMYMDNPEYVALKNIIKPLRATLAKDTVILAEETQHANNPENLVLLKVRIEELKNEIEGKELQLRMLMDSIIKSQAANPQASTQYFLNDLTAELADLEVPSGISSFWTDGSNLTARERPNVGVDLS
jgi:DNA helicase II / ATP-dependent DNA helicase PcrA